MSDASQMANLMAQLNPGFGMGGYLFNKFEGMGDQAFATDQLAQAAQADYQRSLTEKQRFDLEQKKLEEAAYGTQGREAKRLEADENIRRYTSGEAREKYQAELSAAKTAQRLAESAATLDTRANALNDLISQTDQMSDMQLAQDWAGIVKYAKEKHGLDLPPQYDPNVKVNMRHSLKTLVETSRQVQQKRMEEGFKGEEARKTAKVTGQTQLDVAKQYGANAAALENLKFKHEGMSDGGYGKTIQNAMTVIYGRGDKITAKDATVLLELNRQAAMKATANQRSQLMQAAAITPNMPGLQEGLRRLQVDNESQAMSATINYLRSIGREDLVASIAPSSGPTGVANAPEGKVITTEDGFKIRQK